MHFNQGSYNEAHCYQYDIRLKKLETDLKEANLTEKESKQLRISDFEFKYVPKEDKQTCHRIVEFIERHEWLGKMPHRPTHRFIAVYKGAIAGAIVMATPNSFSKLLGEDTRDLEKLIARGACISWSPKNLASALIMFGIRWMVKNTPFRVFTAYSDTEARELGTIYQACNFTYLGNDFGGRVECFDPKTPDRGWFSDRFFRKAAQYRIYAERLGYTWREAWGGRGSVNFDAMPELIQDQLKAEAKRSESECEKREVPSKHKYAYILGVTKKETKHLREKLFDLNSELKALKYPKERGPSERAVSRPTIFMATNSAAENISGRRPLSDENFERRPRGHEASRVESPKTFLSIKEIASRYGVSDWTIYRFIKTDPTFPYLNVGLKKKFIVNENSFRIWMEERTKRERGQIFRVLSGSELLSRKEAL
jgi:predicted DNA-binding transcriptional regulator AlpA